MPYPSWNVGTSTTFQLAPSLADQSSRVRPSAAPLARAHRMVSPDGARLMAKARIGPTFAGVAVKSNWLAPTGRRPTPHGVPIRRVPVVGLNVTAGTAWVPGVVRQPACCEGLKMWVHVAPASFDSHTPVRLRVAGIASPVRSPATRCELLSGSTAKAVVYCGEFSSCAQGPPLTDLKMPASSAIA